MSATKRETFQLAGVLESSQRPETPLFQQLCRLQAAYVPHGRLPLTCMMVLGTALLTPSCLTASTKRWCS